MRPERLNPEGSLFPSGLAGTRLLMALGSCHFSELASFCVGKTVTGEWEYSVIYHLQSMVSSSRPVRPQRLHSD